MVTVNEEFIFQTQLAAMNFHSSCNASRPDGVFLGLLNEFGLKVLFLFHNSIFIFAGLFSFSGDEIIAFKTQKRCISLGIFQNSFQRVSAGNQLTTDARSANQDQVIMPPWLITKGWYNFHIKIFFGILFWNTKLFPSSPLPRPSFFSRSYSPLGSLLTRSSPLALLRPRWQQRRIIQRSCPKNTPTLQAIFCAVVWACGGKKLICWGIRWSTLRMAYDYHDQLNR